MNTTYRVNLDAFQGPLDLLLHLISRLEIDIYDIPVAEITDQYMHYIRAMQQLDLDIASEYLVMSATLLEMKSSMLLPNNELEEHAEMYEEDPREQLLQRLLEYRKFKEAAATLKEKELAENQLYVRPKTELETSSEQTIDMPDEYPVSVLDLLDALHDLKERHHFSAPLHTTVTRVDISVEDRMAEVLNLLTEVRTKFTNLFPYPEKQHVVVTFLAVLQLLKNNEIHCEQKAQFEPIFVSKMRE